MKELLILKEKYSKELESLPAFQNYNAICRTIDLLTQNNVSLLTPSHSMSDSRAATNPAQKEIILNAVDEYFKESNNKPSPARVLREALNSKGIDVPGSNPGVTLGAILNGQKTKYVLAKGFWSAIKEKKEANIADIFDIAS